MKYTKLVALILLFVMTISVVTPAIAADRADIEAEIQQCIHWQDVAHEMAECARALGFPEDHVIIRTASDRWWQEEYKRLDLVAELDGISCIHDQEIVEESPWPYKYTTPEQWAEYPVASQVWEYLRADMGLRPEAAAGIMGNMMAECGGQTLDLQYWLGAYGYTGLCMWYIDYTNGRLYYGCSLEEQLSYLNDTLAWSFDYWGDDYDYFANYADTFTAAYLFELTYERGTWASIRGWNAIDAYNYFA